MYTADHGNFNGDSTGGLRRYRAQLIALARLDQNFIALRRGGGADGNNTVGNGTVQRDIVCKYRCGSKLIQRRRRVNTTLPIKCL